MRDAVSALPNRADRRTQRFGSRAEVAAYLGVPTATLDQWAYKRIGPPYKIIGRHAKYDWARVDAWIDAQESGGDAA